MASWFSRLNPTPSFPSYSGPHKVGTIDVEIAAPDLQQGPSAPSSSPTVAFRCFYPCQPPSRSSKPAYWVQAPQRSTISAYARFLGAGNAFSDIFSYFPQLLYHIQIPAQRSAPLLPPSNQSARWPVLVFSHGLGGSRNSYSHLCGSLASYGMVVVAPEHRDGSVPISHVKATNHTEATSVDYRRISHKASPEVYEGRDEQLSIRIHELAQIHEALRKIDAGDDIDNLHERSTKSSKMPCKVALSSFKDRLSIHDPGSIAFAGHSFGSATTVQFVKSLFSHPSNPHLSSEIRSQLPSTPSNLFSFQPSASLLDQVSPATPTILLDLWTLPLNSPYQAINKLPMPFFSTASTTAPPQNSTIPTSTAPILAILSSAFVNWTTNFNHVKRILSNPQSSRNGTLSSLIFYPLNSAHLSQSDFGVLFPRVTKYFAKAEEPERTLHLNVRAILQMLKGRGVEISGGDDPEILSTQEGAVRGWVAVQADGDEQEQKKSVMNGHDGLQREQSMESEVVGNGELKGSREEKVLSKH